MDLEEVCMKSGGGENRWFQTLCPHLHLQIKPLRRPELRTLGPTTICVKQPGQVGLLKSQFFNAQYTTISGISSMKGNWDVMSNIPATNSLCSAQPAYRLIILYVQVYC